MTDKPVDLVKVLVLPYEPSQFMINRSQCSSSMFINATEPRGTNSQWLQEDLVSGGIHVPLFDLNRFLQDYFRLEAPGAAHLALIRTWDSFAAPVQQRCREHGLVPGVPVGFRVTSATIMADIRTRDFSLSPVMVQPHLCKKGVMALVLPYNEGMRYLIDLDILFADCLLGEVQ